VARINDILGFHYPDLDLIDPRKAVIPNHVAEQGRKSIEKLQRISKSINNPLADMRPAEGIREIYYRFTKAGGKEDLERRFQHRRELRLLSYALTYKELNEVPIFESEELEVALGLLNLNWRDDYISGLLDCYLSTWDSDNRKSQKLLSLFLLDKIKKYSGARKIYLSLKENINYFGYCNGDVIYGTSLATKGIPVTDGTKELSIPESWISYPYFIGVLNAYLEKSKERLVGILDNMVIALDRHSNSTPGTKANKLVISKIICHSERLDTSIQDKLKDYAFRLIGDPGNISQWLPFKGASPSEIETLEKSRKILNEWLTRQFITVFFDICINDKRRRDFWMRYSKQITAFKVFGPSSVRNLLVRDGRLTKYLSTRFVISNSTGNISAFMFHLGQYKMIAFSDPGFASIAYLLTNKLAPSIDIKYLSSVERLRNGSLPILVNRKGNDIHTYKDEGRMEHRDGILLWEQVFYAWIQKKVRIDA
jgi:hypothetical protein